MTNSVRFGYELGTGKPVEVPINHMVITGQTQMAGKTTALEALVARSGVQAVAFITKRGESSFADARSVRPYFRERADWQYVAAILEASRGEKLKFERPWIIRASKGAHSLADVQKNVQRAMEDPKTRGLAADVYLTLNAYLDAVVPEIDRVRWATTVDLAPGVNAMDLTGVKSEMQHLVIRSTLEWVLEHADKTVVVIPEAWKFIPQGRGTPVKLAAEAFIRQSAALGNYLWLDSQDIAGVEKIILKSVPVWVLGVQREINEVERTLKQAGLKKPDASAITQLKLGEFFVCHGPHITKTYAQPTWMDEAEASAIAKGIQLRRGPPTAAHATRLAMREAEVTEQEAAALRAENAELRQTVKVLGEQVAGLGRQLEIRNAPSSNDKVAESAPPSGHRDNGDAGSTPVGATDELYEAIKRRLMAEAPALLKVLTVKPEIEVTVTRETVQMDGKSLRGRVAQLVAKGFFDEGCLQSHVRTELERRGAGVSDAKNLPREIDALVQMGFLTIEDGKDAKGRDRKMYVAVPGMKVNIIEAR